MFSFSILADCCNSFEQEDCKTELLTNNQCDSSDHSSTENEMCHCSFSCSPKILETQPFTVANISIGRALNFPKHTDHFKNLDPLPILQPPII